MKETIIKIIQEAAGAGIPVELSVPEEAAFGHYSTNCAMRLAKECGKTPLGFAKELAGWTLKKAPPGLFERVEAVEPGFINFWLSKGTMRAEFEKIARGGGSEYGRNATGDQKVAIIDYSQPNIAKMMHVGHLRSTIIGDALANLLAFSGYEVIRWNYLGDWGTQFGKLIAAYKAWGNQEEVERDPIKTLQALYVRFHGEVQTNAQLEKQGQEEFKKLEEGDPENKKLWEWFRRESLKEFEKTYAILGVQFDLWLGESFFAPETKPLAKELADKGIAEPSQGALIIKLDQFGLSPALIEKSDGASLYLTRDIASLRYRLSKYHPAKILYVVGNEQSLQFAQLFAIAKILGLDAAELQHIKFGLVLGEAGRKLATREGRTILLGEVIEKAVALARETVEAKSTDLSSEEKDAVARAVAVGALKYNDLKENRTSDIVFDWAKMLDSTGDSAPYLQYTYARLKSILRKAGDGDIGTYDVTSLGEEPELALIRRIFEFPDVVQRAGELYATSILAAYLYKLAVAANKFYETTPILKDAEASRRNARLALVAMTARVLHSGLGLLGITTPEKI